MGNSALTAIGFILGTLINLYAAVVALRFIMQVVRADYYNPVAQFIVTATDPLLRPLRRFIPSVGSYDTASLLLCLAVLLVKLLLFKFFSLGPANAIGLNLPVAAMPVGMLAVAALIDLIYLFFNVFLFCLFVQALMSWLPNAGASPVSGLLNSITAPVLRPIRRFIPPMGGLDLSTMAAIIGLYALRIFVVGSLTSLLFG